MIGAVIRLLQEDTYYGVSKEVEIAKGLYQLPTSPKGWMKKTVRVWKTRKYKKKK